MIVIACSAAARNTDGTLAVIQSPNEGRPVVVRPGETFMVRTTKQGALSLDSNGQKLSLASDWSQRPSGGYTALCRAPRDAMDGSYRLTLTADSIQDTVRRAVFIREEETESYAVAHIADPQVASETDAPNTIFLRSMVGDIQRSGAAMIILTGDLTADGSISSFRALLEMLKDCAIPTYLTPGPKDVSQGQYRAFFGEPVYAFDFQRDAYLSVDTSGHFAVSDLDNQSGRLQRLRRAIKGARWSTAITYHAGASLSMRAQLVLFIDDPVDFLVQSQIAGSEALGKSRWGQTAIVSTPSAVNGMYRIMTVTQHGPGESVLHEVGVEASVDTP